MKNILIAALSAVVVLLAVLLVRQPQAPSTVASNELVVAEPAPAAASAATDDTALAPAGKAPTATASAMCRTLLEASVAGDFDAFKRECEAKGDPNMRAVAADPSTGETFKRASAAIAPSCRAGYDLEFLGSLTQRGHNIYLWKLAPKTAGDQFLVRLTLKNNRLAGFFFQ